MGFLQKHLTTTQIITFSFLFLILIGSLLLATPFASADGSATPFADAMFTATSCVCVTGLVTVTTASHWNLFGHIVILILIQIGGLGVVAITTVFNMLLGKKLSLSSRMLLGDAFNLETMQGLVKFLRGVFFWHLSRRGRRCAALPSPLCIRIWRKRHLVQRVPFDFRLLQRGD